jgi:hypothetical protein
VIKRYLLDVAMREFVLYTAEKRVPDLIFRRKGIRFSKYTMRGFRIFKKGAEWLAATDIQIPRKD